MLSKFNNDLREENQDSLLSAPRLAVAYKTRLAYVQDGCLTSDSVIEHTNVPYNQIRVESLTQYGNQSPYAQTALNIYT
jgi:hypothetical protein